jgi:hypothetical protein
MPSAFDFDISRGEAHTARAEDAALVVEHDALGQRMEFRRPHLGIARHRLLAVVGVVIVLQHALARLVADAAVDGWLSVMSCRIDLRYLRTASESVSTRRPSDTGMLQAISTQLLPSTCTAQTRQLPAMESAGCQQNAGISIPFARAASITVWSRSARTGLPSMKISGMPALRRIATACAR